MGQNFASAHRARGRPYVKISVDAERLLKHLQVGRPGNLNGAKARQMRRYELGVKQAITAKAQARDEMGERDF
jgi:hypothetical protein